VIFLVILLSLTTLLFAQAWHYQKEEAKIWLEFWHSRSEFITKLIDERMRRSRRGPV
jgi:hypothetical protein